MENINELIGIFKAIDFDNVINDKEVICLKNWVAKSRNLASTNEEIEFIKLLDDVLEDNIITSDEKRRVNAYIKKFMSNGSTAAKLYELNGLIRGVLSDGEVNTPEIVKLHAWLKVNHDVLGQKHVRELYNVLDETITGKRITKEKKDEIFNLLENRLNDVRFQTKLDHLRNLTKARKNIGPDIIELLDKNDAIEIIHDIAEKDIEHALRSSSGSFFCEAETVFISLVLIGMFEYDGNFYEGVARTYSKLYNKFSGPRIEGCIRNLIRRYKPQNAVNSRTINLVLSNSIVPKGFLGSFFAFIYDIYKINFDYDFDSSSDPYEDFKFIYEGLRSLMLNNSDDVSVKVTNKSYKLIKSTKELIINPDSLDALIKLSIMVMKLIDRRYWNQVDKDYVPYNPYLKQGFCEWAKTIEQSSERKRTARTNLESYSRWEPKLCLKENMIVIVPPVHKLKADNPDSIRISVTNGEEELMSLDNLDIREIFGGYKVISPVIPVDKPLGKLQYMIYADEKIIYDSKNKLYRNVIVFDENGEEIKNNTDHKGTAVFCFNPEELALEKYYSNSCYSLAVIMVKYGDSFVFGNTVFTFSSLVKPGIYGTLNNNCAIIESGSNKRISSFKEVKFLMFESANKLAKYNLIIDHEAHKLSNYKNTITEHDNKYKYVVDLNGLDNGLHNVSVMEHCDGSKKKIYDFNFVVDKSLAFKTNKISNNRYEISVVSDVLDRNMETEIDLSCFDEKALRFTADSKDYYYELPLELPIYRINDGKWRALDEYIWIEEIKQDAIISFFNPAADSASILLPTGEITEKIENIQKKGIYFDIPAGFLNSFKAENDYIVITLSQNEKVTSGVYCYNKCVLRTEDIKIDFDPVEESAIVSAEYYGVGNVYFEISDANGVTGYTSELLMSGEQILVKDIPSFEPLNIVFYEKGKGLFKKVREIARVNKIFYGMNGLIGKDFKISEVYYDQKIRGQVLRKTWRFRRTYLQIISRDDSSVFTGKVYYKTWDNRNYYLNKVNPVTVEVCSNEIDGQLDVYMETKEGDGLLIDFKNSGILNNIDDHDAIDIYSCSIVLEE